MIVVRAANVVTDVVTDVDAVKGYGVVFCEMGAGTSAIVGGVVAGVDAGLGAGAGVTTTGEADVGLNEGVVAESVMAARDDGKYVDAASGYGGD